MNPVFDYSVVIPAYNRGRLIQRSIQSVLNQRYRPREIIVVNDASTDDTAEKAKAFPEVTVITLDSQSGANRARNVGIEHCHSPWVAFQDSDDLWLPHKSEVMARAIESSDQTFDWLFSKFIRMSPQTLRLAPEILGDNYSADHRRLNQREIQLMARVNLASTQTMLVRKELLERCGGFDEQLPRFQDWDLALRLLEVSAPLIIDEPLVLVYVTEGSISKNYSAGLDARQQMLKKELHLLRPGQKGRRRFLFDLGVRQLACGRIVDAAQSFVRSARF